MEGQVKMHGEQVAGHERKEECMERQMRRHGGQVGTIVGQGTWKEAWGRSMRGRWGGGGRGGLGRLPGCGEANQP
jgi:hypothetical protein